MLRSVALLLAWVSCVGYSQVPTFWLLAHPFAERWRGRRRPYAVLAPLWLLAMLAAAGLTWPWREVALYATSLAWIAGAGFMLAGLPLYHAAHRDFTHDQLLGRPELEDGQEQRLVTGGIRARLRHPVYLAHLCELAGLAIASGLVMGYALLAYSVGAGVLAICLEDAELERRFGGEYRAYRARVPALFPALSARRIAEPQASV